MVATYCGGSRVQGTTTDARMGDTYVPSSLADSSESENLPQVPGALRLGGADQEQCNAQRADRDRAQRRARAGYDDRRAHGRRRLADLLAGEVRVGGDDPRVVGRPARPAARRRHRLPLRRSRRPRVRRQATAESPDPRTLQPLPSTEPTRSTDPVRTEHALFDPFRGSLEECIGKAIEIGAVSP